MAGGEREGIANIATKIAEEITPWLKWNTHPPYSQNFTCQQASLHKSKKQDDESEKVEDHNHPADAVYSYKDPYTNKQIILNTDLKSYAKGSIKQGTIRSALKSMAQTIDCARLSKEWRDRYSIPERDTDIRGMLFVYNHDGGWDSNFYEVFYGKKNKRRTGKSSENEQDINIQNIDLQKGQQIHIMEPGTIKYIRTIIDDFLKLRAKGEFNTKDYQFHYPDLNLHKVSMLPNERPATLELISAPFMIVEYQGRTLYGEDGQVAETIEPGHKVYYKEKIKDWKEMFFLIDSLSNYQILNNSKKISIRAIGQDQDDAARSFFRSAADEYVRRWGKSEIIKSIEFEVIPTVSDYFSKEDIGW
ncbi:hypothetical protein [Pseudomonas aeruginosa]|uniref:hypothetical protein n=1 Tax=Pseudomonas aeruginosa TaxID=287 RepID=UPI001F039B35|nr:hypothetical protein [Pseudomonas aeruginosa]